MRSSQTALGAVLASALAVLLVLAGPAFALPFGKKAAPAATPAPSTAKPAPAPAAPGAALDIKGFRSATFGMTPAQAKTAITADFGPAAKMQEGANPTDGTHFIIVSVDHLDPGPGAGQIGYVFGATSKTLSAVNVLWMTGATPTQEQRQAIATAGQQLVDYFKSGPAAAKTGGPSTFGTNGIVLYSGVDKKNAGVMIALDGVFYSTTGDKPVASPPPKGPASLRVSYMQDADKPDIKTLKPGSF